MSIDPDSDNGLVNIQSISPQTAQVMVDFAIAEAMNLNLRKMAVGVMGIERFLLAYSSAGGVTPNNLIAVQNKLETVMNVRRSIHTQIAHMKEEGTDPNNYGAAIKTLFIGGFLVYSDESKTRIVGAIASSGGNALEDSTCCAEAVAKVGLFTDGYNPYE